ncbi:Gamma-aminobutyric acid receptor subunit beta-like [Folsomia candida]|uniref:Gamma-aminobutyric acid receptor subunit beta-like n=1 Tax=Folsomia candida TaxID=158441 RepID=A0A226DBI8_FOLCA|nr:Gamma-aminobutyric acid receptor subunit beta-like [Folsomia candida]
MSNLITLKYDSEGGYIQYITKIIFKFALEMDFKYYPLDSHSFKFRIRGFSYNEKMLNLMWEKPPIFGDHDNPNFDVQLESFSESKATFQDEKFDELSFKLIFRRKISYHVVQTFIPSLLLIVITWLCFFMPQRLVEVRVGICMTIVLPLTAMQDRQSSPKSAYVKALDIWMVGTIFFVFLILFKLAVLIWLKNRKMEYEKETKSCPFSIQLRSAGRSSNAENGFYPTNTFEISATRKLELVVDCISILERRAFPCFLILFSTFLAIYWGWVVVCSGFLNWPRQNVTLNPNL